MVTRSRRIVARATLYSAVEIGARRVEATQGSPARANILTEPGSGHPVSAVPAIAGENGGSCRRLPRPEPELTRAADSHDFAVCADALRRPFADRSIDVGVLAVLHHFADCANAARCCAR